MGVGQPIDAPKMFVLAPLEHLSATDPALASALATYESASPAQQAAWNNAYSTALSTVTFTS